MLVHLATLNPRTDGRERPIDPDLVVGVLRRTLDWDRHRMIPASAQAYLNLRDGSSCYVRETEAEIRELLAGREAA